jgi:hypothetical protein
MRGGKICWGWLDGHRPDDDALLHWYCFAKQPIDSIDFRKARLTSMGIPLRITSISRHIFVFSLDHPWFNCRYCERVRVGVTIATHFFVKNQRMMVESDLELCSHALSG